MLSSPARAKALAVQHRRPSLRNRSTADSARPACVGWVKPVRAKPLIGGFHPPYNPEQPAQATLGDVIQPTRRRVGVRPNRQVQMVIRYGKSANGNRENLNSGTRVEGYRRIEKHQAANLLPGCVGRSDRSVGRSPCARRCGRPKQLTREAQSSFKRQSPESRILSG